MRYIPHTEEDVRQMLAVVGVQSIEDLFEEVPSDLRLGRALELPGLGQFVDVPADGLGCHRKIR